MGPSHIHIRWDRLPLPTIHEQSQFYLDEGNVHFVQKSKAILLEGVMYQAIVMNCRIIIVKNLDIIIQTMVLSQKGHLLWHLHQLPLDTLRNLNLDCSIEVRSTPGRIMMEPLPL